MKVDAKNRLLSCAIKEFALKGFEGASTREIVKQAGMNISAISYYFGSKEGLYTEILHHVVNFVNDTMSDLLERYDVLLSRKDYPEKPLEAAELLKDFIRRYLQVICTGKKLDDLRSIFIQEYSRQSEWFYNVLDKLNSRYFDIFVNLLLIIHCNEMDKEEASLSTFMIFSQIFVFFIRKDAILSITKWKSYNNDNIDEILRKFSNFFRINPEHTKK